MFDSALHPRVILTITLVALALSGAVAGAPTTTDVSSSKTAQQVDIETGSVATNVTTANENVSATVAHEGNRLELLPTEGQNVTIRTDADAGTELTVLLREDGNYVAMYAVTVSADGTAIASLDLRGMEPGSNVTLSVHHGQERIAQASGVVSELSTRFLYEGERLVVRQAEDQQVRLQTNANPGSEIVVEARAGGKFLKTESVIVTEGGTATATFDFSDVAANTEFTFALRRDHGRNVDGIVVNDTATIEGDEPLTVHSGSNLTVRGEATADPGTRLVLEVDSTEVPSLTKRDAVTVSEDGTFEASFDFGGVTAGTAFEVTVIENATLKSGSIEGEVVAETTTAVNESDETTTTPDDGPSGHADEFLSVPGFGVPAALVALVGALALARRTGGGDEE